MLKYYQNYLNNVALSPNDSHLDLMQATINDKWIDTTQSYSVLQEQAIGSDLYDPVDISVDMVIDMGTGVKKSDDFKTFSHRDMSANTALGIMYQWKDNYWISTNTSELGSPIKSTIVRRCNNIAKWIDPLNGYIYEQRCVLDYIVSSTNPKVDKDLQVQSGKEILIMQGNINTLKLTRNQRFIFNEQPYKIIGYNNMLQNGVVDNSTTLLYFDIMLDILQPTDDIVNNIANRYEYNYTLEIENAFPSQISGFVGQLIPIIKLNGEIVQRDIQWGSNEHGTIDTRGNYKLLGGAGHTAIFTATLGSLVAEVNINIVDNIVDFYDIVVSPSITVLNQGSTATLDVNLYKNGIKQNDIIIAQLSGADSLKCYTWQSNGNNIFMLKNNLRSLTPLNITFTSGIHMKNIDIELKSMF